MTSAPRTPVLNEVCVDSVTGATAAWTGGGDRIELCAALELGGLTPSAGLQEQAAAVADALPVHVLIRPRSGDFVYDRGEIKVMARDVGFAVERGAAAAVVGALAADGTVERDVTARLIDAAQGRPVTFHRAFDMVEDQWGALDTLIELGVTRVLTSGGRLTAAEGSERIAELVRRAGDAIVILAGSGITPMNAAGVVRSTGVREIHFSARKAVETPMRHRNPDVLMGASADQVRRGVTSSGAVAATVAAVADL